MRLAQYGPKELKREERISPFTLFTNQFKNILIVIFLVAVVLSAVVSELVDAGIVFQDCEEVQNRIDG